MALNMFVIEHAKAKSSLGVAGGPAFKGRSAMMDSALRLAFDVFGILIERCNVLLQVTGGCQLLPFVTICYSV